MQVFKSGRSHMALVKDVVDNDAGDPYYVTGAAAGRQISLKRCQRKLCSHERVCLCMDVCMHITVHRYLCS